MGGGEGSNRTVLHKRGEDEGGAEDSRTGGSLLDRATTPVRKRGREAG